MVHAVIHGDHNAKIFYHLQSRPNLESISQGLNHAGGPSVLEWCLLALSPSHLLLLASAASCYIRSTLRSVSTSATKTAQWFMVNTGSIHHWGVHIWAGIQLLGGVQPSSTLVEAGL